MDGECLDWDDFEAFDDETLIPVNLTQREMAILRTAIFFIQNGEQWCFSPEYYSEASPLCETILFIIRQEE